MQNDDYKFERSEDGENWEPVDSRRVVRVIQDNFNAPVETFEAQLRKQHGFWAGFAFYRIARNA